MNHKTSFKLVDGKITMVVEQLIWGEWVVLFEKDVTDEVMPVVDDYLDEKLGLDDYKRINGVVTYVGKDAGKYRK